MNQFKSGWDFVRYSEIVRTQYRFAYPSEVTAFLQALVATSGFRAKEVPASFSLWRAQRGCNVQERQIEESDLTILMEDMVPFPSGRMKPRKSSAHEGRANPKGIPCLYMATDKETAMAEVRPWIGAQISVGHFQTTRSLKVVDFSLSHDGALSSSLFLGRPSAEEVLNGVWAQVDRAFSEPIADDPDTAEYVPTQVIAETFRREGFDGVVYKSRLGDGFNIALFDLDCAELVACSLFKAEKIAFSFRDESRTYYARSCPS